jgi:hypothetical protein
MCETWKPIKGYEGLYEISNIGNVASLNYCGTKNRKNLKYKEQAMGYCTVGLSKDGKAKTFLVHRLVAEHFVPNPNGFPIVNHKDENKSNNRADNLEWCTYEHNNNHGTKKERISQKLKGKGINSGRSIAVIATLPDGTEEYYPSMAEVGRTLSASKGNISGNISKAIKGKTKTAYGRKWRYVK